MITTGNTFVVKRVEKYYAIFRVGNSNQISCFYFSGSLQIRYSQETDEGKYECMAENSAGVAYSYGANLYVRGMYENRTVVKYACTLSEIFSDTVKCLDG